MVGTVEHENKNFEPKAGRNLTWSGQIKFMTSNREMSVIPPPSFMKEGLGFPGEVELVVDGQFGMLIRDKNGAGYIVTSTEEPNWIARPGAERVIDAVTEQEHFFDNEAEYDGIIVAGCMRSAKTVFLKKLSAVAARLGRKVLFVRPERARKGDGLDVLLDEHPDLIRLEGIEGVDRIMGVVNSSNADLVVLDEMNLLMFGRSLHFVTKEQKAEAVAKAIEQIIKGGRKFAGALLNRYATGEAFPPINEILNLQIANSRIELVKMHAQCLCGASAEVQAMTELYYWQGEFVNGDMRKVRPLVPIIGPMEAVDNFYGPLCFRCHHRIHGKLAEERWAELDFSRSRDFSI